MEDFRKSPIWIAPTEELTVDIELPAADPAAPLAPAEPKPAAPPPSDPQD